MEINYKLEKRFSTFVGVDLKRKVIESGIERLGLHKVPNNKKEASYYKSISSGTVKAKKAITLADQSVDTTRIITPHATFVETKSISSFVKVAEQLYITDDIVLKRNSKKASKEACSSISTLSQ